MEYFMPRNVLYNGIATAESYKILAPKAKQTPKDIKLANYLGWCFEMLGDSCNIVDDIMDQSETRRNQPCWHNVDGIGLSAINDALLLETSALYILKKHFGKLDCFLQLLDIFHDLSFSSQLGQQAEARSAQNVNNFTVENFESIAMNLITNFTGYIPVALAMTLAGYPNLEPLQEARAIHKDLGLFYIVQNDYMDCFGDPEVTGKVGTDIQEGKCRWLSFACMEVATPEQKATMKAHYGKDSAESVAIIKQLYIDLNLPKIYDEYTTKIHERLMMNIANLSDEGLRKVFLKFAETIYYAKNMNLPLFK
ncbi:farnesyl pyrophosphate synthase-like [Lutzomyia longipalpis]|uniref:farnesyl pyrophosphate synthase-like n=1 Tax=Lutzomyia longipalpis TaxID=7200 RepID=UPI0024841AF6|nr:farnesyl pyrophosphate synthase-like [Lutzomyia longipalpis]